MKETVFVELLLNVDLSEMVCPFITIYEHPDNYPQYYIGRLWDVRNGQAMPTNIAIKAKDKYSLCDIAGKAGFNCFISRSASDDKCIVGTLW